MCRTCVYASITMVTCPGVSRNSIGYGCPIILGMPGGKQLAVSLSSGGLAKNAFFFASYSGVRSGPDGRPAATAPRPEALEISHTPLKSGNFATAAQSAAVGAGFAAF